MFEWLSWTAVTEILAIIGFSHFIRKIGGDVKRKLGR